ncbi:MAG: hypothetical protein ABSB86_01490 [Bryobacteraceae bacterium]
MTKPVLTAAIAAAGALLLAQDKASAPTVPVQTIVTVEAHKGKNVSGLNREDVVALEGKQRLQVSSLTAGEAAGLELFLLIDDASGESLGSQLFELGRFIENQPPATAIGIGYMRNGGANIAQNFTKDHLAVAKALRLPLSSPGVSPSPFESLSDLIKRWPATTARREVILVTSGIDPLGGEADDPYLNTAIQQAQRNGVIVYALYTPAGGHLGHSYWRMNWGQNHLSQLAEETGGESYMLGFGAPVSFAPYLNEIADHLAHQYIVGFQAIARNKAGLQSVRFTTELPNTELVSASKVWFPAGL